MNRVEIKTKAKEMIKGNLLTIWKPFLVVFAISFVLSILFNTEEPNILSSLVVLALTPLSIGSMCYLLKFVRKENPTINDVFSHYKNFFTILLTSILVFLAIFFGAILLIVPGIILSLGLSFFAIVLADPDYQGLGPVEVFKESLRLMKGYKSDFFVFGLSFFGWGLLVGLTFGIAAIWVMPYQQTATILYYEELKKIQK